MALNAIHVLLASTRPSLAVHRALHAQRTHTQLHLDQRLAVCVMRMRNLLRVVTRPWIASAMQDTLVRMVDHALSAQQVCLPVLLSQCRVERIIQVEYARRD